MSIKKIIGIASIPIIISILISLYMFSNQKISHKPNDWASFATWMGLSVSLSGTILLGFLTWKIHRNEERREREQRNFLEALERPICVFITNDKENGIDKWWIQNVGRGAAINLHVGYYGYYENKNSKWNNMLVKSYSIEPNGKLELKWLHKIECSKLIVYYTGITSIELYCTLGQGDNSFPLSSSFIDPNTLNTLVAEGLFFKTVADLLKYKNVERRQTAIERVYPNDPLSWI